MVDTHSGKSKRGRPSRGRHTLRANRVVTFVTDTELEVLEQLAKDDERSLSAVVHRIITIHMRGASE